MQHFYFEKKEKFNREYIQFSDLSNNIHFTLHIYQNRIFQFTRIFVNQLKYEKINFINSNNIFNIPSQY